MIKLFLGILATGVFWLLAGLPVIAQEYDWSISSFHSDIEILSDGEVKVEEQITVNFSDDRHGIIRTLPYLYTQDDGEYYTEITVDQVLRGSTPEPYETDLVNGYIEIKIGDASETVTGNQKYLITYRLAGVLASFETYDELYWNVTGNDWGVPIGKASARVTLPQAGIVQASCYEGVNGSTTECTYEEVDDKTVSFVANEPLSPDEGLTVAVGYTPGMVPILRPQQPPSTEELLLRQASSPLGIGGIVAMVIAGIGLSFWLWYRQGRDWWWSQPGILESNQKSWLKPWLRKPQVVVEFTPPLELRPAVVGMLKDQKADTLDITTTIVDLASRGYVTITEIDKKWVFGNKDYQLHRTGEKEDTLLKYEQLLLDRLFKNKSDMKISELKNTFYNDLEKVKDALRQEVMSREFFVQNPKQVRERYILIGIAGLVVGIGLVILGVNIIQLWVMLVGGLLAISGIGIIILSGAMPQRTAKGFEAYRRILGYELFISTAEKYKQRFLEDKNIFTEILPYAMVFGLTDKLAKALQEIGVEPPQPTWYHGTNAFNAALFSQNINSMSSAITQQMASTPSGSGSGGGGSSGGGFGGGGGGSW